MSDTRLGRSFEHLCQIIESIQDERRQDPVDADSSRHVPPKAFRDHDVAIHESNCQSDQVGPVVLAEREFDVGRICDLRFSPKRASDQGIYVQSLAVIRDCF